MVRRQIPRWSELKPLLRVERPQLPSTQRRLAQAHTIADLRAIARRRTPRAVFDYTDGAAEAETSLQRARQSFRNVEFHPSILRDVSKVDTSATVLGKPSALPFSLAPTGFTRMMHTAGEAAVVRAAQEAEIPYALSTMGTTSIEDTAAAGPDTRKWFQLYVWRDRGASRELVRRAREAGYEALILTVDTPVGGARMRDVRNGLSIPPALTMRTILDGATHPAWWFNLLTTEPLQFATFQHWEGTVAELINEMFDPSLNYADLEWLRAEWDGPLIIKGVQNTADAVKVVEHGADAVILSNHGGRQLDRAPTMLELLPHVREALGDRAEILLDTGVLSGADIIAGLARGADSCLIGRAYLYGLMAGGQAGVQRAVEILRTEISRTMQLLGVSSIDELTSAHATLRG